MTLIGIGMGLAVLITSMLSGVLGMGGGMLLMGVMVWLLPATAAMTLHGIVQLVANGSRTLLHIKHVEWRILPFYSAGACAAFLMFHLWRYYPKLWLLYLLMGCMPWLALHGKNLMVFDIEKPGHAIFCGFLVSMLQMACGVSGPALDIFYLHTRMSRHRIVASKALTQSIGHALKTFYYAPLMASSEFSQTQALSMAALALTGTILGAHILDKANDESFQRWSRRIILGIGCVYLALALRELIL